MGIFIRVEPANKGNFGRSKRGFYEDFPQNMKEESPLKDNTTTGKKIQPQIKKFLSRITKDLSKPKRKFVSQILFEIQAARDIKLSNISRSLNEDIKLIKTENRLSRHITGKDLTEDINTALIKDGAERVVDDTLLALDLLDINKPFAKKRWTNGVTKWKKQFLLPNLVS